MSNLDFLRRDRSAAPRSLFDEVFSMLDDFNTSAPVRYRQNATTVYPAVDVHEKKDAYHLTFDVPGLRKEDINIEITGRQLVISGERKREEESSTGTSYRAERLYGHFQRSFDLPEGIKSEVIEANYRDGVLEITIPKAEAQKARKIAIGESEKSFFKKLSDKKEKEAKAANA